MSESYKAAVSTHLHRMLASVTNGEVTIHNAAAQAKANAHESIFDFVGRSRPTALRARL